MLGDQEATISAAEDAHLEQVGLSSILKSAQSFIERLQSVNDSASALSELVERVELSESAFRLEFRSRLPKQKMELQHGSGWSRRSRCR